MRTCDMCDNPATCTHKAGHSVSFRRPDGTEYDDPERDCFLCDDCCGHSGEEGECFSVVDGRPMDQVEGPPREGAGGVEDDEDDDPDETPLET